MTVIRENVINLCRSEFHHAWVNRWCAALGEVKDVFQERLIEVTPDVAEWWGRLQAIHPLHEVDALLAASALNHDLTLVTRNQADFAGLGFQVLNPFQSDSGPPSAGS